MRNFLPFILLQLLLNGCSSQSPENIQSNNHNVDLPKTHHQQRIITRIAKNGTQFTDLCEDVLLEIFSNLSVVDFLNLSKSYPQLSHLLNDAFRRKYRKFDFGVRVNTARSNHISEDSWDIQIYSINKFKELTTHFGHSIRRIHVKNRDMFDTQAKEFNQIIQEHCADTLTHLNLDYIKKDTFESLSVPFKNVEEVSLMVYSQFGEIKKGVLPLNELFPNVQRFQLSLYTDTDYSFLECTFPHLEYVRFNSMNVLPLKRRESLIHGFLKKNPQISSIELYQISGGHLKIVNDILPNLKQLTLHELDFDGVNVHFEQVKHLSLHDRRPRPVESLSFSCLETLEIRDYLQNEFNSWMTLLRRNKDNLKQLYVFSLDVEEFPLLQLTGELDNLVEMTLQSGVYINVDSICQFIDSHEKLNRFLFTINIVKDEYMQTFRERYENDWYIEKIMLSWSGLLFERKIPNL